jgi:virginiamycin B lyase
MRTVRGSLIGISTGLILVLAAASPATAAAHFSFYPLPTSDAGVHSMAAGRDDNVWFTETSLSRIGRVTPSGVVTEFQLLQRAYPQNITAGPDGAIWFTEARLYGSYQGAIGRITSTGTITEYVFPPNNLPYDITTGSDGNLWVTFVAKSFLRRVTPEGVSTKFDFPNPNGAGRPQHIVSGPDGALWFTLQGTNQIDRMDPVSGSVIEYPLVTGTYPGEIASGPDGKVWFTAREEVGSITVDGQLTEYPVSLETIPAGVTTGPDGNLWFALYGTGALARMDPALPGAFTRFRIPGRESPDDLVVGPDGRLWFNQPQANQIGALAL